MAADNTVQCVLVGAGDHARVLIDLINDNGHSEFDDWQITALTDSDPKNHGQSVMGIPVIGGDDLLPQIKAEGIGHALVGVGLTAGTERRARIFEMLEQAGFGMPTFTHPGALIGSHIKIDSGSVILAGAIIGTGCHLGKNVVINIGAGVSHDCTVEDNVVVSDGAHVTGGVTLKEGALIGAGATILPYVTVGKYSVVAAGAVVTKDVGPNIVVAGVPAREMTSKSS